MKTKELFKEMAPDYSPSNDPWGNAMSVYFVVCEVLTFERSEPVEAQHHFNPPATNEMPDTDRYEYEVLVELNPSDEELHRLARFCHRLTNRLERAGRSY